MLSVPRQPSLCLSAADRLLAEVAAPTCCFPALLWASHLAGLSRLCSADIVGVKASLLVKHSTL